MTAVLRLVEDPPYQGVKSEEWMEHAECNGEPTTLFFDYRTDRDIEHVRRICNRCPVRKACLDYAMTERIDDGMFGGYTELERRRIRRGRNPIIMPRNPVGRPPARVTTGDRIRAELAKGPLTAVQLQDRLGLRQNTISHWTGVLRREGSITAARQPGRQSWLYQIRGDGPAS